MVGKTLATIVTTIVVIVGVWFGITFLGWLPDGSKPEWFMGPVPMTLVDKDGHPASLQVAAQAAPPLAPQGASAPAPQAPAGGNTGASLQSSGGGMWGLAGPAPTTSPNPASTGDYEIRSGSTVIGWKVFNGASVPAGACVDYWDPSQISGASTDRPHPGNVPYRVQMPNGGSVSGEATIYWTPC